jgi:hypothetical protein
MPTIETRVASIEHQSAPGSDKPVPTPNVAGTTAVRRRRKPLDLLGISPQQMNAWGIKHNKDTGEATEGLRWVRNKDCNVYANAPEDRVASLEYELDGAEPVRVDGKIITRHDVMLMKYPKEYDELAQAEIDQETKRLTAGLYPGIGGVLEGHEDLDAYGKPIPEMTNAQKKAMMAAMHEYHTNSGMIGPTARLSLADAIRVSGGPAAVAAEEERYRRGASHREISQEEFGNMFSGAPSSPAVRNFHGIGATGLGDPTPKTIQQKRDGVASGRRAAAIAATRK